MQTYIIPSIIELNTLLLANINDYLGQQLYIEQIMFSVFIVVIILVFFFIWSPYLESLNNKIWRTKGMLNMIPVDIITKHKNLKEAFNNDFFHVVK